MQELAEQVESLQVTTPRRSVRKRSVTEPFTEASPSKRKTVIPPTKMTESKLKQFYLNKSSARFARNSLETIYEVPQSKNGITLTIGTAKIKRALNMDNLLATKQKKLQRKKKIQRLGMKRSVGKKISKEKFLKILSQLESEDDPPASTSITAKKEEFDVEDVMIVEPSQSSSTE